MTRPSWRPTVNFDRELTLCSGDEEVQLVHPAAGSAHTDGDTVVYYRHANIVQTGDLYFEAFIPTSMWPPVAGSTA